MERAAHQLLLDGPEHAAVPRVAVRRLSPPVESAWPPSYLCANLLCLIPPRRLLALASVLTASGPTRARSARIAACPTMYAPTPRLRGSLHRAASRPAVAGRARSRTWPPAHGRASYARPWFCAPPLAARRTRTKLHQTRQRAGAPRSRPSDSQRWWWRTMPSSATRTGTSTCSQAIATTTSWRAIGKPC